MSLYHLLANTVDTGLILLDDTARIRLWNRWIEQRAALSASAACGLELEAAFGPTIDPRLARVVREALDFGCSARLSHALHPMPLPLFAPGSAHQERLKQSIDVLPVEVEGRRGCLLQIRDVTETVRREALLKQQARQLRDDLQSLSAAQAELQRSELRFRELARLAPAGIFETDEHGRCTFLNERCAQILGAPPGQLAGRLWISLLPADEQARVGTAWQRAVASATRFAEEFPYRRPDGAVLWMRAEAGPQRDDRGGISGFIGTMLDVTDFHERATRNEFRADHDSLTTLLNRDRFERQLRAALSGAREIDEPLSLLFIDLDNFKQINDTHGHAAGDLVLKAVAKRVRRVLRSEDPVARYGGDEFAVLLHATGDKAPLESIIAKIAQAVGLPINLGHCHVRVSCSIGAAQCPQHGSDAASLLHHADQAMYAAKRARGEPA